MMEKNKTQPVQSFCVMAKGSSGGGRSPARGWNLPLPTHSVSGWSPWICPCANMEHRPHPSAGRPSHARDLSVSRGTGRACRGDPRAEGLPEQRCWHPLPFPWGEEGDGASPQCWGRMDGQTDSPVGLNPANLGHVDPCTACLLRLQGK